MSEVRIVVDDRERGSRVPEYLKKLGATLVFRRLDVGDYLVSEDTAIERKRADDLIRSLYDGRLFDQIRRLSEVYARPILVVEGDFAALMLTHPRPQAVYGALVKLIVEDRIPILFAPNAEHAAMIIYRIAYREQHAAARPIPLRHKKKLENLRDWQLFIVESLPGVGPVLARRLLEHFGSVRAVFNASSVELCRVEGMTEAKAREIIRVLTAPFTSKREQGKQERLELG